jgi:hypothetical protein
MGRDYRFKHETCVTHQYSFESRLCLSNVDIWFMPFGRCHYPKEENSSDGIIGRIGLSRRFEKFKSPNYKTKLSGISH